MKNFTQNPLEAKKYAKYIFNMSEKSNELPFSKGIYCIYNIFNKKCIVGLTNNNFRKRLSDHRTCLRGNYHDNDYLQKSYIKYGENIFQFIIIEELLSNNLELLKNKEKYWIFKLYSNNPKYGYNLTDGGEHTTYNEESRDKFRKNALNRKYTSETRSKLSKAGKDRYNNGELVNFINAGHKTAIGNKNNIGKSPWNKGLKYVELNRNFKFKLRKYDFIDLNGEEIHIENLTKFCYDNDLNPKGMREVFVGTLKSYKGYIKIGSNYIVKAKKNTALISPSGKEILVVGSLKNFCIKNNLDHVKFLKAKRRNDKCYNGWRYKI